MGSELGSGAAEQNAGPAYRAASEAAWATIFFVGTTAGAFGPIRLAEQRTRWSTAATAVGFATGAATTGAGAGDAGAGAGAGAGGSSPRLRIRTSSITSRCLGFSFVGDGCLRAAGLAGGDRRPACAPLTGVDAAAAALGAGEGTAAALGGGDATAATLGGGEDAPAGLGLRRRRGFVGDGVNASRCIRLLSASWDLSTAVAMAAETGFDEKTSKPRKGSLRGGEVRVPPRG
ncbi:unnamed protein product [Urochloa decumbens]|uniref:Uncharacterized protein n=1 Tax=Urochloa decumbens TaxID=240449 RepID=A0ABC8V897_9POAL